MHVKTEFIYMGEVILSEDELESFLSTASFLRIRGLEEEDRLPSPR
jgi:hypothetical protein